MSSRVKYSTWPSRGAAATPSYHTQSPAKEFVLMLAPFWAQAPQALHTICSHTRRLPLITPLSMGRRMPPVPTLPYLNDHVVLVDAR
jgi:hypothetical protein